MAAIVVLLRRALRLRLPLPVLAAVASAARECSLMVGVHADDALDHIIDEADTLIPVTIAREGMLLDVSA